jgi:chromosome segregation ATPase
MSDTWDEASLDGNQATVKPPEMTTDDLVMMVGEANINLKHSERVCRFLKQRISDLTNAALKEESVVLSLKEQIATLSKGKTSVSDLIAKHNLEKESFHNRIVQLENQIESVAKERDDLKNDIQEMIKSKKKRRLKKKEV